MKYPILIMLIVLSGCARQPEPVSGPVSSVIPSNMLEHQKTVDSMRPGETASVEALFVDYRGHAYVSPRSIVKEERNHFTEAMLTRTDYGFFVRLTQPRYKVADRIPENAIPVSIEVGQ